MKCSSTDKTKTVERDMVSTPGYASLIPPRMVGGHPRGRTAGQSYSRCVPLTFAHPTVV
jgi:hypothetical protein